MKVEKYDNGMGMECRRYTFDEIQTTYDYSNNKVEYNIEEVEIDDSNVFFQRFVYVFYYLNDKLVYSEIK